ncbi:hypothetical protein [Oligella urethralis]|uniref:hypothetical protein n=1 Tax=Oligella urethralis TaxID=90245 RepID=UPI001788DF8F|nr:hypothetical protein [Oligella urethralis]
MSQDNETDGVTNSIITIADDELVTDVVDVTENNNDNKSNNTSNAKEVDESTVSTTENKGTDEQEEIINQWFKLSKQKLTPDDPMVTMLMVFDDLLIKNANRENSNWNQTLLALDQKRNDLNKTISKLNGHKEEIIIELDAVNRRNISAFASSVENEVNENSKQINQLRQLSFFLMGVLCINLILLVGMFLKLN